MKKQINAGLEDVGADVVKLGTIMKSQRRKKTLGCLQLIRVQECFRLQRLSILSQKHWKCIKCRLLCWIRYALSYFNVLYVQTH